MNKLSGFDLVERARALQPLIAAEANEIERTRRLTQPVVSALLENGLYRALLPKSLGGSEAPLEIFMQMQEEIAKADASTAWCLGQCSVCAMVSAYIDPEPANEIFNVAPGILAWGAIAHTVIGAADLEHESFHARDTIYGGLSNQDRNRNHEALTFEWRGETKAVTADLAVRHDIFNRFKDATSVRAGWVRPARFSTSASSAPRC